MHACCNLRFCMHQHACMHLQDCRPAPPWTKLLIILRGISSNCYAQITHALGIVASLCCMCRTVHGPSTVLHHQNQHDCMAFIKHPIFMLQVCMMHGEHKLASNHPACMHWRSHDWHLHTHADARPSIQALFFFNER